MSGPYWHTCGAPVDIEIDRIGFDYLIQFRNAATGKTHSHCPRCQAPLYAAYRDGHLTETSDHHRSRPTTPHNTPQNEDTPCA